MKNPQKLLIANWKMHKTAEDVEVYFAKFLEQFFKMKELETQDFRVIFAAPYVHLSLCQKALHSTKIEIAAQNLHWESKGAYTGEISPAMLTDVGVTNVIVGHSERRQWFNETDETINKKLHICKKHNIQAIFCVGESLAQRQAGETQDCIARQLEVGLKELSPSADNLVIAYEPIWAIGTGMAATPKQVEEVHQFIRAWLTRHKPQDGNSISIVYGGSVKPENLADIMSCEATDGGLVGGASLDPETFAKMANELANFTN